MGAQSRNNSAAKGLLLNPSLVRLTHMVKGVNQLPKVVLLAPPVRPYTIARKIILFKII